MDKILELGSWILANYQAIITALVAALVSLIALFSLIPGEQPDKALQAAVDFLSKFSLKSKNSDTKE